MKQIFCGRFSATASSAELDGLFYLSSFRPNGVLVVSAAPLTFVDNSPRHLRNVFRKSFALRTAVQFALHLKKNGTMFEKENKMATFKQLMLDFGLHRIQGRYQ